MTRSRVVEDRRNGRDGDERFGGVHGRFWRRRRAKGKRENEEGRGRVIGRQGRLVGVRSKPGGGVRGTRPCAGAVERRRGQRGSGKKVRGRGARRSERERGFQVLPKRLRGLEDF